MTVAHARAIRDDLGGKARFAGADLADPDAVRELARVAGPVAFLASPRAAVITGTVLDVRGGIPANG